MVYPYFVVEIMKEKDSGCCDESVLYIKRSLRPLFRPDPGCLISSQVALRVASVPLNNPSGRKCFI